MGAYSKLHNETYREIRRRFPEYTIRENIRPDWLVSSNKTKLELDIYIEEIKTAVEIQGLQHYQFVPYFHKTYADFKAQQKRDREKRDLCYGNGVRLVEIAMRLDLDLFIKDLLKDKEPDIPAHILAREWQSQIQQEKKQKKQMYHRSKMRSKRWRQWLKKKIMRKKGLLPPAMAYKEKLPGSWRMRNRARHLLKSRLLASWVWDVWGGENRHQVVYQDKNNYKCDCPAFENKHVNICSHVIHIMMKLDQFPKPELVEA